MSGIKLKSCPFCGRYPVIERWSSGGPMFMVKCNNGDCDVPLDGYPSGRDLTEVAIEWNRRAEDGRGDRNEM